jgi:hypothetical protein
MKIRSSIFEFLQHKDGRTDTATVIALRGYAIAVEHGTKTVNRRIKIQAKGNSFICFLGAFTSCEAHFKTAPAVLPSVRKK